METINKISVLEYNSEPGVGTSYNIGWDLLKNNFVELLLLIIISMAVNIPVGIARGAAEAVGLGAGGVILGLMGMVIGLFIAAPVGYGVSWVFLKLIRREDFDVSDVFAGFKDNYLNVILANLLVAAIVIAGILFLIIPGIIFACKLAFVPYLVMDKKMDAVDAVKTSWNMTKGYTWTIFLIGLLAIPIAILGLLMLVVGLIPAIMWIEGASAAIYYNVDKKLNPPVVEEEIVTTEE